MIDKPNCREIYLMLVGFFLLHDDTPDSLQYRPHPPLSSIPEHPLVVGVWPLRDPVRNRQFLLRYGLCKGQGYSGDRSLGMFHSLLKEVYPIIGYLSMLISFFPPLPSFLFVVYRVLGEKLIMGSMKHDARLIDADLFRDSLYKEVFKAYGGKLDEFVLADMDVNALRVLLLTAAAFPIVTMSELRARSFSLAASAFGRSENQTFHLEKDYQNCLFHYLVFRDRQK